MSKESDIKKELLYPIGHVAKAFNISVATIRLYEAEGLLLPLKTKGKHRLYSEVEIKRIACIRQMIADKGFNLASIKMVLSTIPCWEIKQCSEQDKTNCDVYRVAPAKPCWQVEVRGNICSVSDCRECEVYTHTSECSDIKTILRKYWRTRGNDH